VSREVSAFRSLLSNEDVNDIIADFYLHLLENDKAPLKTYDPRRGCRLHTWLSRLATNRVRDFLRHIKCSPIVMSIEELVEDE
jgi:hypothetical protein